jgi:hypothetical protein
MLIGHMRQQKRPRSFDNDDGVEFVRCRICGDYRRVISGRHLSKHDTDRETYMEDYILSPDEMIVKDFRIIQSSRRGYYPYGKSEWIAAGRRSTKGMARFLPDISKTGTHIYMNKASGFSAIGIKP